MMFKRISILLSSLLLLSACGGDNISPEETKNIGLDFNLVQIGTVSEPDADGMRKISLDFSDKTESSIRLTAVSGFKHLEAGRYRVAATAQDRLDAVVELTVKGQPVQVTSGTLTVVKKNYEYRFRFDLKTENQSVVATADGKKLYFESHTSPSSTSESSSSMMRLVRRSSLP